MRTVRQVGSFKRDLKKITKRSKDLNKIYGIVEKLAKGAKLESRHRPHALVGNYVNKMECHIEPDWLLIYKLDGDVLILEHTGSHADLFE